MNQRGFQRLTILFLIFSAFLALATGSQTTAAPFPSQLIRVSVSSQGAEGNDGSYEPYISSDGRFVVFESLASNLVRGDTNGAMDIFVHELLTGFTARVSMDSDGNQGNDGSYYPVLSADGRFVAFASLASNLVPGDTNGVWDVFVYDRQTHQTSRVSVSSEGTQGDDTSIKPDISADGRLIAFYSSASNLVPGDTNGESDVFVYDRLTGETRRVSIASDGTQGNDISIDPSISPDGHFITYTSNASNLVPMDINGVGDIFGHDLRTGRTSRVSLAWDGAEGDLDSLDSVVSEDGRFVTFISLARNLVPFDTNASWDIFVRDLQNGLTSRVSVSSEGVQANWSAWRPSIRNDGRYVVFNSDAWTLVPDDTNFYHDVFVHDRQTGQTTRISLAADGSQGNDDSFSSVRRGMNSDGGIVTFLSWASNLVPGDNNDESDIFILNRGTGSMSVSGQVVDATGLPLEGVALSNGGASPLTDSAGYYTFTQLITGTYTLSPHKDEYAFTPAEVSVTVPPEIINQDFVGWFVKFVYYLPVVQDD